MSPLFELGNDSDRVRLAPLRAEEWRGALTAEQFAQRNQRLYKHAFGQKIKTYVLRGDSGEILSSMDGLPVTLGQGAQERFEGFLVASVFTPNTFRGMGFGKTLLDHFFQLRAHEPGVLYSDIGAKYYERWGFCETPVYVKKLPAKASAIKKVSSLSFNELLAQLTAHRSRLSGDGIWLCPQLDFFDWQVERFRLFAAMAKQPWDGEVGWECEHQGQKHVVFAAPNFISRWLEGMWVQEGCGDCAAFLQAKAAEFGLEGAFYWTQAYIPGAKTESPMAKVPGKRSISFLNPQRCDWW